MLDLIDGAKGEATTEQDTAFLSYDLVLASPPVDQGTDIDDFVNELEATAAGAQDLALARKWLARQSGSKSSTISDFRLRAGLSQKQLAAALKTSQSYVCRLELGVVDPGVKTITRIAGALNVADIVIFEAISRNLR